MITELASTEESVTAIVTLCSAPRLGHLRRQLAATEPSDRLRRVVVWLDDGPLPDLGEVVLHRMSPGRHGLRLAAGRNLGAEAAIDLGADLLVFLDADCIPGTDLLHRYRDAARSRPDALLCGPVTYLPEGFDADSSDLRAATDPHPARPAPAPGRIEVADPDAYNLFWSLSFAVRAESWPTAEGFDERYEGYGAEDTDFARRARERGQPLVWVGGADAYHQYHPVSRPPWEHLADIVLNANLYFERWGEWPMGVWLDAFQTAGAISLESGRYRIMDRSH